MKNYTKKLAYALFLLLLIINLCSCSSNTQEETQSDIVQPAEENTQPDEPQIGGEVTVGVSQDLDKSLDPHVSTSAGKREILFNIFEGLVKPDEQGNLVPALAESFEISESGDVFTFKLRPNVLFHNGKALGAEDVIYSIDRCRGVETDKPLIAAFSIIESVESPDAETVVIKLSEPNIELLSYLNTAIIPSNYDGQETFPIGTGPFKFVSRSVQENIVMEKFTDYWGTLAYLDKVTFKIIENPDALVMALRSGAIDLCVHRTPAQVQDLHQNFSVLNGNGNLVQALYLNNLVKPLDDIRVRQALNYAIDIQAILDMTSDGMGTPVGSSMYPSFGKYYIPELAEAYPYDPDKAKSLLAEAGYADGFDLTITVPSNYAQHVDVSQVVADQLQKIGINARISLVEWASWLSEVYSGRNFEATISGFDASALTARAMLERWVSDNKKNMINFNNEEYDTVMHDAMSCTDDAQQVELYKQAETILSEQAANVYLQDPVDLVVMNKMLDGYAFYPMFVIDMAKVHY